jgi:hypothetical protein
MEEAKLGEDDEVAKGKWASQPPDQNGPQGIHPHPLGPNLPFIHSFLIKYLFIKNPLNPFLHTHFYNHYFLPINNCPIQSIPDTYEGNWILWLKGKGGRIECAF